MNFSTKYPNGTLPIDVNVTFIANTEDDRLIQGTNHVHELIVASLGIGKAQGFSNGAPFHVDDGSFMVALGDIDSNDQHRNHLEKMLRTALLSMRIITYCEMRRRHCCRDIRLINGIPQGQRPHS